MMILNTNEVSRQQIQSVNISTGKERETFMKMNAKAVRNLNKRQPDSVHRIT